jgi:hypothetical protein
MAPCTIDGFAHRTAPGGRIHQGNPEFTNVDGLALTFTFGPGQVFYSEVPNSEAYGGHALKRASRGRIPEFTYIGVQPPSHLWP